MAHNGLASRLVNQSKYDGVWVSSLCDSASRGLPDNELVTYDKRLERIEEIRENTTKPIIVDWDTGGQIEHFPYWVKKLSKLVDAIIIEDKAWPKQNSLLEDAHHNLEDIDKFCEKIREGKKVSGNMMIIARLESLIAKHSVYEALIRAEAFIDAGADGIMIHSKSKVSADEVMEFATKFREKYPDVPLIAVPTTYTLPKKHPFNIVIDANQLLRASIKGMQDYLKGGDIVPVEEIFKIIGTDDRNSRK